MLLDVLRIQSRLYVISCLGIDNRFVGLVNDVTVEIQFQKVKKRFTKLKNNLYCIQKNLKNTANKEEVRFIALK